MGLCEYKTFNADHSALPGNTPSCSYSDVILMPKGGLLKTFLKTNVHAKLNPYLSVMKMLLE